MKIDRILEIIVYLINHDHVPARYLAERFHVSIRTIQRDMVSISVIGIPIYSNGGKNGGYSILPSYKMINSNIKREEQQLIMKALESLATSYTNNTLNVLLEKYNTIVEKEGGQKVFWDFGVTKENKQVQNKNERIETAITNKNYVGFDYKNANGEKSKVCVEPLAIQYKWYAWYLFAFEPIKNSYKTFKVARMQNLNIDNRTSQMKHDDLKQLLKESENAYFSTCIHIEVQFEREEAALMEEYFPDCPVEVISEKNCRIFIDVPAKERLWKALLLSFGDRVKVIAPESYRDELINTAQKFLSNYDI